MKDVYSAYFIKEYHQYVVSKKLEQFGLPNLVVSNICKITQADSKSNAHTHTHTHTRTRTHV